MAVVLKTLLLSFALVLVHLSSAAAAQPEHGPFTDPDDGQLDASEWLLDRKGFLPVPIVITEPAVGYGGGVALLFFRESLRTAVAESKDADHVTPPDIFGGALAATENGTKVGGVGGMFSFADDRWRYRGGLGNANVNLDFHTSDIPALSKIGYNLDGWVSSQQLLRRLGATSNFVALRWIYLDLDNTLDTKLQDPPLLATSRKVKSSGLGVSFEHDSRDNIFTPSKGWFGAVDSTFYAPAIGSDKEFQIYRSRLFAYTRIGDQLVLGTRLDGRAARGDVPLYQLPYIDLRGIPAARYQDRDAGVAETELRWNVTPRWALIGFIGAGRAWGTREDFSDAETIVAKGGGVRYLMARRLGLYAGIDVASGPEEDAVYLTVGSAWR